jgi:MoaA/NifB/PqqE/SkfB family radical SAM enzyme
MSAPAGAPVRFLQIEPTTRCNFTCGFCAGRAMPQTDLPWERFLGALEAFPALEHIELQGEGEPLLHPRFFDMVAHARARAVRVSIITNGSLFSDEAIERILSLGIDKIAVSIESPDPERFQQIRGGKLDKVLRGVAALVSRRNTRALERPTVGLSITVLRSTQAELPAILALYDRLGLDGGITLQPLQAMEAYAQHYGEALREELLTEREADRMFARFFTDADVRRVQASRGAARGFFDELMAGWKPAKGTCPWLEGGLYVHNGGAVTACCMVKDTARHGFGVLGDGEALLDARDRMRTALRARQVPAPCTGCELARFAVMGRMELVGFGLRGLRQRWFGGEERVRLPVVD